MTAPPDHTTCRQTLLDGMASQGIEVTASEQPPLVIGLYTTYPFICPHNVPYWLEPTGEQIAQWAKDGTP